MKFEFTEKKVSYFFLSFQDQQNKTALPVIHLIDSMQSGVIDYKIVKSGSNLTKEVINISWEEHRVSNMKISQIKPNFSRLHFDKKKPIPNFVLSVFFSTFYNIVKFVEKSLHSITQMIYLLTFCGKIHLFYVKSNM